MLNKWRKHEETFWEPYRRTTNIHDIENSHFIKKKVLPAPIIKASWMPGKISTTERYLLLLFFELWNIVSMFDLPASASQVARIIGLQHQTSVFV